jgi:hypothetical protein
VRNDHLTQTPHELCIVGIAEGAQMNAVKNPRFRHFRQRITDCCGTVHLNMLSKMSTNLVKRLRQCVERRGEHTEHTMQIIREAVKTFPEFNLGCLHPVARVISYAIGF